MLVLFFIQSVVSYSQTPEYDEEIDIDTSYIVSYRDIFTPRIVLLGKRNQFTLTNNFPDSLNISKNELTFKTNSPMNLGLGFTYKWIGINLAFNLGFLNGDKEKYGKTKRFDLSTHLYARKFVVDLGYQWYKGYYLSNPQGIIPGWKEGDPYPTREDVAVTSIKADGFYIFKHKKFSYRSAFTFNERQKKSAGSPILGAGLSWYFIRADSSLLGGDYSVDLDSITIKKANLGSLYVIGGYAQNFVVKYFYLSLTLGLGFGGSSNRIFIEEDDNSLRNGGVSLVSVFKASIGYNNDLFYAGLSMYANGVSIGPTQSLGLNYSSTNFNIYVGYRFYNLFNKK